MSEPPQTIVQAGGRVAESIVSGFTGAPALLLIVLLNVVMILAAVYFLNKQETTRAATVTQVTELLTLCFNHMTTERPSP